MSEAKAPRLEPAVALGTSARSWAGELMSYAKDHPGIRVVGTILSTADAIELAYDVLVVDDIASFLSPRLVDRLQRSDRAVIGVYDPERGGPGRQRLLEIGVDAVIVAGSAPEEFIGAVHEVVERRDLMHRFAAVIGTELVGSEVASPSTPLQSLEDEEGSPGGRVVAVTGSSGVLEVMVGIGVHLAGWRRSTLLVDLDTLQPALAQRLDLDLTPNVVTALEALRFRGDLNREFTYHAAGFAVLGGLPSAREWSILSEEEVVDLLRELALGFEMVLVRVDRHLEDLSTLSGAVGRFGVSRSVVAAADAIVGVADPSPVGVAGLVDLVSELRTATSAPVHLALNRTQRGPFLSHEVLEELRRSFVPASVALLPEDQRVRKAAWQGEAVVGGRFMKALGPLAAAVGAVEPARRRTSVGGRS